MESVLLKKYKLLCAVVDSSWATRLDDMVAAVVIDRYSNGKARVSLCDLENATGSQRNKIIPSLRRIIDSGVISVIRQGTSGRPTEYDLNFDFASRVHTRNLLCVADEAA
jgi:hypothetical protein